VRAVRRPLLAVASLALALTTAPACRRAPPERARVAVTIFPIYDLARRIAGDDADVALLLPPGETPHGKGPGADAVAAVAQAKLVVAVGLGLDDWVDPMIAAKGDPKLRVLKVGDRAPTRPGPNGDGADPHVWLDPQRARLMATAIVEDLARVDPSHALAFRKRAEALDGSLAALDQELEGRTAKWTSRGFLTFHPAFAYFAERYRLEVVGVIEKSPGVAPTDAESSALVRLVEAHKLRAVFREPQLAAAPAEAIAREAHVPVSVLDPLGGASTETDSYEELLRFDTAALESGLGLGTEGAPHAGREK
jgi:ABC-type Zn uptake system ZnuABC Zn-binding protein ZnuA